MSNELFKPTNFFNKDTEQERPQKPQEKKHKRGRRSMAIERETRHIYRRAFSETQLLDITPKEYKKGHSYHFITAGDVDALSYLKTVLRQQPIKYAFLSTWVIASDDILQIEEWLIDKKIEKIDFYIGEIFPKSYPFEWEKLKQVARDQQSKLINFKNHSKVMGGIGDKYTFAIEISANINTNPRTEQANITIDRGLFEFYYKYFDNIQSFTKIEGIIQEPRGLEYIESFYNFDI